jgi:hypothetical protein
VGPKGPAVSKNSLCPGFFVALLLVVLLSDLCFALPPFSRGKYESEVSTFQGCITSFGSSFVAFPSSSVDFDI